MKNRNYLALLVFSVACASTPKPMKISSDLGPEAELNAQKEAITAAYDSHVDVVAPEEFKGAKEYLSEARDAHKDGDSKDEVYEKLGISKAYLAEANKLTTKRQDDLRDVLNARKMAMDAGATPGGALKKVDEKLVTYTEDKDEYKELGGKEKSKIEKQYLGTELGAIKGERLETARRTLDEAKANGAAKYVPEAYAAAQQKYSDAEKVIELDRHSDSRIETAVKDAEKSATNALSLAMTALEVQKLSPEERARVVREKERALQTAANMNAAVVDENLATKGALVAAEGALAATASENEEMRRREREDAIIRKAASEFDKAEAEVYRQGDQLVIRLKQISFPTGKADVPTSSVPLLTKVKSVLMELTPEKVVVEGHTDDRGAAKLNQTLSERRAESVAKFFESDSALQSTDFETEGLGYSKPLTSNKTSEGRAQNRRVDIIVTPSNGKI